MSAKLLLLIEFLVGHVPANTWALVGVCMTFAGFWVVGRQLLQRSAAESALAAWGLIYLLAVAATLAGVTNLRWIAGLFLALVVGALFVGRRELRPTRNGLIALLLLLPVALAALFMPLLGWDSYWHWVLNGSYLYWLHHFPATPLEGFPSFHPTYPMATTLIYYFSGLATGRFPEAAGTFMNLMLTLIALDCVIRLLRAVAEQEIGIGKSGALYRYGLPVAALCIVLSLNPSFRTVNFFSAIADPALGVIVMVMICRWCSLLAASQADDGAARSSLRGLLSAADARRGLLLLFLLGVLIGGVKQSGWVLAFVLSASGIFVGILRKVPWVRSVAPAAVVFSGTGLAQGLWSMYLSAHLAIPDQFSIKPIGEWRFDLLPALLEGMKADLLVDPYFYGLVLLTVVAGLIALLRRSSASNAPLPLMLSFVGVAMPIHFASLFAAYLGTGFPEWEVARAASLHRYSTHIGFAACTFGLVAAVAFVLRRAANSRLLVAGKPAVFAALALYALPLGWNVLLPAMYEAYNHLSNYQSLLDSADRMSKVFPPHESVALFGKEWAVNLGSYYTWRPSDATRGPVFKGNKIVETTADLPSANEDLKRWMTDPSIDHIWLFNAPVMTAALGQPPAENIVWSRATGEWRVIDEAQARVSAEDRP